MEIKFRFDTYTVNDCHYSVDDNNVPVDIIIYTDKETCDEIADKYSLIGYNYSDEHNCGLFGRLGTFELSDASVMQISKHQLRTLIKILVNTDKYYYPDIASAVMALGLPEEVAMMVATEYASREEW